MKKRNVLILVLIIVSTLLLGISALFYFKKEETDALKFSKEYGITEENIFTYRTSTEIINILKHGTGVVYLGFPECPWCKAYVSILNEVAKENNVQKIYYFNILEDRKNNTENYQKIISLLDDNLLYDEEGNKRIYVPDITVLINGEIIGHNNETSVIAENITPEQYWTEEKKQTLKNELKSYFEQIKEHTCSDICDR